MLRRLRRELKKDWGGDYEANLGKAARAAQLAGFDLNDGERLIELLWNGVAKTKG